MGLLLQSKRGQRLRRLRRVIRQLMLPTGSQRANGNPIDARPDWLLLFFDVCWLAGLLILTLYISWVYDHLPAGDPREYYAYALAFWRGSPPFHAFPAEYPPLALIPFSFTLWPSASIHFYWAFAGWMGLIVCLSYLWFARMLSRSKAIVYAGYILVGATGTLLMRFDLLPALATLGSLVLAERQRYVWAYGLLAISVLLKIYPVFLVPVLLAHHWRTSFGEEIVQLSPACQGRRQHLRSAVKHLQSVWLAYGQEICQLLTGPVVFLGLVVLGFSVPAVINWQGTISEFQYHLARPLQIESTPASLLWLGTFLGYPARPDHSFGSLNLVGPLDGFLKPISLLSLLAGILLVYWRVLRGKMSLGQGFVATIAVVLATNKILSPQYLLWILPLAAYVEGFDLLWLVICALTTLIFPFLYQTRHPIPVVPTNPAFLPTIAVRDVLLVVAAILAIRTRQPASAGYHPFWRGRRPRSIATATAEARESTPSLL